MDWSQCATSKCSKKLVPSKKKSTMKYVIMAAGHSTRWKSAIPKQMAIVNYEPVLYRTVRLLRSRGIEPIVTARHAGQWNIFNEFITSPNEVEIDRIWGARSLCPAIFLYGDCYYSTSAIDTIVSNEQDWAFFGRRTRSRIKPHGELFAIKANSYVIRVAKQLRADYLSGVVDRCIGWDLFWRCIGMHTRIRTRRVMSQARLTEINDETDDFDSVREYRRFLASMYAAKSLSPHEPPPRLIK